MYRALEWTLLFSISTVLTFDHFCIRWQKGKSLQGKSLHLDDVFNVLALGSLLAFAITYQVYLPIQYNYQLYALGLGGYLPNDDQLMYAQNVGIVNIVFFWVTMYLVKASFLITLLGSILGIQCLSKLVDSGRNLHWQFVSRNLLRQR